MWQALHCPGGARSDWVIWPPPCMLLGAGVNSNMGTPQLEIKDLLRQHCNAAVQAYVQEELVLRYQVRVHWPAGVADSACTAGRRRPVRGARLVLGPFAVQRRPRRRGQAV